jgi:hypothetical protein
MAALALTAALAGCGGGGDADRKVAQRWVDALNARDWKRACALQVRAGKACETVLRAAFRGTEVKLREAGDNFAVNMRNGERLALVVEERGGEKRVAHGPIQVIR